MLFFAAAVLNTFQPISDQFTANFQPIFFQLKLSFQSIFD